MPPITVDPDVLAGAGESVGSVGDQLATAIGTLTSRLAGGARSGVDPAGLAFGQSYQQTAQALLDAGAAAANAARSVGFGVRMSATNYSRADASSTIGGGTSPLNPPDAPTDVTSRSAPSSLGGGVPPPFLWSVIQSCIPDVWPDGSPGQLRATAVAWQHFSSTITDIAGQLTGPSGVVVGQQIPEGAAMSTAIFELSQSLSGIAGEAGKLATQTSEFADDVESTQNAIRDLLDRVSPGGVWDGIQSIFGGDALEELKEVADDVKTVLGEYARQAEGRRDMLQIAMGMLDDAIVSVENWARREFPKYLGGDVGNALATSLDFQLTLRQGLLAGAADTVTSIGQLDPLRFAYDPEGAKATWAAMGESLGEGALYATAPGVLVNPVGAFNHYQEQLSDAVHAEDWSSDRPGYGLGKILFDVGVAAIPGGAALRGTKVAEEAVDAATPSTARIADLPGRVDDFAPIADKADDITAKLDDLGKFDDNVQTAATPNPAGPSVPRDLVESPQAPRVSDAPDPRVSEGPTSPDAPSSPSADQSSATNMHSTAPTQSDLPPTPQSSAQTATPTSTEQQLADRAAASPNPHSAPSPAGEPGIGGAFATNFPGESSQASPTTRDPDSLPVPQSESTRLKESPAEALPSSGALTPGNAERLEPIADGDDPSPDSAEHKNDSSTDGAEHSSSLEESPYAVDENGHYLPGSLPSYAELLEVTKSDPNSAHYWSGR